MSLEGHGGWKMQNSKSRYWNAYRSRRNRCVLTKVVLNVTTCFFVEKEAWRRSETEWKCTKVEEALQCEGKECPPNRVHSVWVLDTDCRSLPQCLSVGHWLWGVAVTHGLRENVFHGLGFSLETPRTFADQNIEISNFAFSIPRVPQVTI